MLKRQARRMRFVIFVEAVSLLAGVAAQPHLQPRTLPPDEIRLFGTKYHLAQPASREQFISDVQSRLVESAEIQTSWKHKRHGLLAGRQISNLTSDELRQYFHPPAEALTHREHHGFDELLRRVESIDGRTVNANDPKAVLELRELAAAAENARRSPIPQLDPITIGFLTLDFLDKSIGGGDHEATNIVQTDEADRDGDPPDSMFWSGSRSIETADLFHGFGRDTVPDWSAFMWEYDEPKTSAGSNPGFEVRCGRFEARLKFGETRSESFTARVFHALGYHADHVDHVAGLKVRYNRRILREFNLRRQVLMKFRLFGLPVISHDLQKYFDPLACVQAAVLKDGSRLDAVELRERLFIVPRRPMPEADPDNFNAAFESQIDHLVMEPVNFQLHDDDFKSVGRWDYSQLGHQNWRELRGAGLLAAWLGFFDCRFDNTSLKVRSCGMKAGELRACFSDLGSGLGRSDRGFSWKPEDPDEFPWAFTKAAILRGPGRMTTPFEVVRFHTIEDNAAFQEMTEADARWMARRIARLSTAQIKGALIASGMDASETILYLAKLVYRRNKMIADLHLAAEFVPLDSGFEGRKFDYDPMADGLPSVSVNGFQVQAPLGDNIIVNGRLQQRTLLGTQQRKTAMAGRD